MTTFNPGDRVYYESRATKRINVGTVLTPEQAIQEGVAAGTVWMIVKDCAGVWCRWDNAGVGWMPPSSLTYIEEKYTPSQVGDREDDI